MFMLNYTGFRLLLIALLCLWITRFVFIFILLIWSGLSLPLIALCIFCYVCEALLKCYGIILLSLFKSMVFQFESMIYWYHFQTLRLSLKTLPLHSNSRCLLLDLLCFCSGFELALRYVVAYTDFLPPASALLLRTCQTFALRFFFLSIYPKSSNQ